jgi:hypothetical protein
VPFDLIVEVEEGPATPISEDPADRRGADAAHTDQADPQLSLLTATPGDPRACRCGVGDTGASGNSR